MSALARRVSQLVLMHLRAALLVPLALFVYVECEAGSTALDPVPGDAQEVVFNDGIASVFSRKQSTTVMIQQGTPLQAAPKNLTLVIGVSNASPHTFDVMPEAIEVRVDGHAMPLLTPDQLESKVGWNRFKLALLQTVAQGSDRADAENAGYTRQSGNISSSSGRDYAIYNGVSYDAAEAARARAEFEDKEMAMSRNISRELKGQKQEIDSALFRRQTLGPGSSYVGVIVLSKPLKASREHKVEIRVDAGGETHEFQLGG